MVYPIPLPPFPAGPLGRPSGQILEAQSQNPEAQPQTPQMGHKVTLNGDPLGVRGFDMARPGKWLGFELLRLGFEDLARGSAKGSSRERG